MTIIPPMARALLVGSFCVLPLLTPGQSITHDSARKLVTMTDGQGNLSLRLNYEHGCFLEQVTVRGREVIAPERGVCSGIKAGQWFTTRSGIPTPRVIVEKDKVT